MVKLQLIFIKRTNIAIQIWFLIILKHIHGNDNYFLTTITYNYSRQFSKILKEKKYVYIHLYICICRKVHNHCTYQQMIIITKVSSKIITTKVVAKIEKKTRGILGLLKFFKMNRVMKKLKGGESLFIFLANTHSHVDESELE